MARIPLEYMDEQEVCVWGTARIPLQYMAEQEVDAERWGQKEEREMKQPWLQFRVPPAPADTYRASGRKGLQVLTGWGTKLKN